MSFMNGVKHTHNLMIEVNSDTLKNQDILLIKQKLFEKLHKITYNEKVNCNNQLFDIQITWEFDRHSQFMFSTISPFSDAYVSLVTKHVLKNLKKQIDEELHLQNWSFLFFVSKKI